MLALALLASLLGAARADFPREYNCMVTGGSGTIYFTTGLPLEAIAMEYYTYEDSPKLNCCLDAIRMNLERAFGAWVQVQRDGSVDPTSASCRIFETNEERANWELQWQMSVQRARIPTEWMRDWLGDPFIIRRAMPCQPGQNPATCRPPT